MIIGVLERSSGEVDGIELLPIWLGAAAAGLRGEDAWDGSWPSDPDQKVEVDRILAGGGGWLMVWIGGMQGLFRR